MRISNEILGTKFLNCYDLNEFIDAGGNGKVYKITRKCDGMFFALKYLRSNHNLSLYEKRKSRFKNEIETLKHLNELKNPYVMPIIDYNTTSDGLFWYIMPIGTTICNYFHDNDFDLMKKITYFIDIAKGLKSIHEMNYYHRDIKPNNIIIVNNEIKLADFGLVWHPSFIQNTNSDEKVGPIETIAPEMIEDNLELKHSEKSDVFSFVKTIWMLILERNRAFVGQYSFETIDYLVCDMIIFKKFKINTLARLNDLIKRGTEYLPINRPSINEVIIELELFVLDNQLPEKDISLINHKEVIQRSLFENKSDIEVITNFVKIWNFISDITSKNIYIISNETIDFQLSSKIVIKEMHLSEIENGIIFESTSNKRFLLIIKIIEVHKLDHNIILESIDINLESLPYSDIYDYRDVSKTKHMDLILGDFEEESIKTKVLVLSKSSKYNLSLYS